MILDVNITEKSFGPANLMPAIRFSVGDDEKVGLIGRNGVGKTTLFNILLGLDTDYSGEVIFRRGSSVVATAQEHHDNQAQTVMQYILSGLPEYASLSQIIETYPDTMGDNLHKINQYTEALARFENKGFYQIEDQVKRELANFQIVDMAHQPMSKLSGGQKRMVEIIKVMHAQAQLALIDEPTNHMDYLTKQIFLDWMRRAPEAMLIITHDRDVLSKVDRIIEIKDGKAFSYVGNYDAYLAQNTVATASGMNEYEVSRRQIENLRKRVQYARSKKASWTGTADKRNPFVVMERRALKEIKELEQITKPSFWIDQSSVAELDYKQAERYAKYKARNIRVGLDEGSARGKRILAQVDDLSLGYSTPLFQEVNFVLRDSDVVELRGRNGAGKTTLVKTLLGQSSAEILAGEAWLDPQVRVGIYEQEVAQRYFNLPLRQAVERVYLDQNLSVTETKVRQILSNYLFTEADIATPVRQLSGGQKARLQIISMLANDPQLLILDEPTNHLDLPSIEELENALEKYSGAILFISHDNYFRRRLGGQVVQIGAEWN